MRLPLMLAAVLGLTACNAQESSQKAVEEAGGSVPTMQRTPRVGPSTTGAAGATTSATDPNPTGAGATAGAQPGDPSGAMGSTPPTLPQPEASNTPTPAPK